MKDITEWFAESRWGVFCHWLGALPSSDGGAELSAEEWNRQVDAFDAKGLAEQLSAIGAPYFFITIGQDSGHFLAPNATYDRYVAIRPSKCSRRDLVSDLYDCLHPRGIELLVYLPCGAPAADPVAVEHLGWEWGLEGGWPHWGGEAHRQATGGVPEKVGGRHTGVVDTMGNQGSRLVDRRVLLCRREVPAKRRTQLPQFCRRPESRKS